MVDALGTRRQRLVAHLLLLGVVLVWGTTFSLVKQALAATTPLVFNLCRMALATAALLLVNGRRLRKITAAEWRFGALAGVLLGSGYQLQTAGLARTTPSKSGFITGLVVVLVPLLSLIPGVGQGSTRRIPGLLGAAVAFGGLILLTTEPGAGGSLLAGFRLGEWLTLLCAFAFALHLLTLSRAAPATDPLRLGVLQIAFATLLMVVTLPLGGFPVLHLNGIVVAALLVTGLLATAAAFTIQSWASTHISASHLALIFTLEPVFAWLTSLLVLHERLTHRELDGAALILLGIAIAEFWPASRPVPPAE